MPIVNRVAAMQDEITAWRRDLHAHPELGFDVHRTAGLVADRLRAFGCDEIDCVEPASSVKSWPRTGADSRRRRPHHRPIPRLQREPD